jgi:hypothetical protein
MGKKTFKKIKKTVAKFDIGGQLLHKAGLPDPLGDMTGLGPGAIEREEAAERLANQEVGSVTEPGAAPTAVSDDTLEAREAMRKRQLAAAGMGGTMLTSSSGLSGGANTAGKSLLGS